MSVNWCFSHAVLNLSILNLRPRNHELAGKEVTLKTLPFVPGEYNVNSLISLKWWQIDPLIEVVQLQMYCSHGMQNLRQVWPCWDVEGTILLTKPIQICFQKRNAEGEAGSLFPSSVPVYFHFLWNIHIWTPHYGSQREVNMELMLSESGSFPHW